MTERHKEIAYPLLRWSGVFLASALLAGCATGPDYQRPVTELPAQWPAATVQQPAAPIGLRWWSVYEDAKLERLVEEALAYSPEGYIAAARVLEARARAGIADADRYPAAGINVGATRTRSSREAAFPLPAGTPNVNTTYRATLDMAWEIDFWGKYRRASEAARAEVFAAEAARDAALLSLATEVVQQYFALVALDAQHDAVNRVLIGREETARLTQQRLDAGISSAYDFHLAEAEVSDARARMADISNRREAVEAGLSVLLGRSPRAVMESGIERRADGNAASTRTALMAPAGLPSDLLMRRPDLREAEQRLVAANARIGAARAEYFPAIRLTGYVGSESVDFANLFTGPAGIFQFALGLSQPLFNAGRLGFTTAVTEAARDQALAQYRRAVANAFADVRKALAAQRAAYETAGAESARAKSLREALALAEQRFEAGIASRLETLDAERGYLAAELARIDAERAGKAALADLVKALGGGWDATAADVATSSN